MSQELDRLPPPAFPPGSHLRGASRLRERAFPEDALISPDEPLRPRAEASGPEGRASGIGEAGPSSAALVRPAVVDPEGASRILTEVGRELRESGPSALLDPASHTQFESVLRGFLAGYFTDR